MKRLFMLILTATFFLGSAYVSINAENIDRNAESMYSIHQPYEYPVVPGTDEWNSMSIEERVLSCLVDEEISRKMDSEALLRTVLNFPFIINIGFYNSIDEGVSIVASYFTPLSVLLEREDAIPVLLQYIQDCKNNGNIADIDYAISSHYYTAVDIMQYCTKKAGVQNGAANYKEEVTRYYIDPIYGVKYDFVDTPVGTPVFVYFNLTWSELSTIMGTTLTYDAAYAYSVQAETIYSATLLRNPKPDYNCHSYAWYSQNTGNHYWMENPSAYTDDGSFHLTVTFVPGRKVTYTKHIGTNYVKIHSAVISAVSGNNVTVKSKWGCSGLFSHNRYNCPYYADEVAQGNTIVIKYYYQN